MAALHDGQVVIRDAFKTTEFWSDIRKFGCTGTLLVGAMANFLYRQEPRPDDADNPLRYVVMAPVIPEVDDFKRRFGCDVVTAYSMTELSVPIVSWEREVNGVNYRSCGRVRPGVHVRVVDDHDYPVGPGVIGELVVRSDEPWALSPTYWRMPEKTVEAWRNGWFHTGDAFRYDENGDFFFMDRIKDAIRRRGENISSFEVEAAVNSYQDVLESAAVAVPSEWSEDEVKVAVVPKPGRSIDPAKLIEFLIPRMPRFALPRYIEIVETLPKTPTERVQKAIIREAGVSAQTWDREKAAIESPKA
jgi:crotonobetaine/carnitine-CoA ligase